MKTNWTEIAQGVGAIVTSILAIFTYLRELGLTAGNTTNIVEADSSIIALYLICAFSLACSLGLSVNIRKIRDENIELITQVRKEAADRIVIDNELNNSHSQAFYETAKTLESIPLPDSDGHLIGDLLKFRQSQVPQLTNQGILKTKKKIEKIQEEKFPNENRDESVAILQDLPEITASNKLNNLNFRVSKYSYLKALRHQKSLDGSNSRTQVLSGSSVTFCSENQSLVVHQRTQDRKYAHHYPGKLHTFGGHLSPKLGIYSENRDNSFHDCIQRELWEESGIVTPIRNSLPFILIDEFEIDFIQGVVLGVNVSKEELEVIYNNRSYRDYEGEPFELEFSQLEQYLKDISNWVPSGWCQIMFWLSLDAPGSHRENLFGDKSGKEVFESVISFLKNDQYSYVAD